jgi:hypothetical protein
MDTDATATVKPSSETNAETLQPPVEVPGGKGAMREPTQKPGQTQEGQEELKQALQEVEEKTGDWSKGG